jgi:hypothetical protein
VRDEPCTVVTRDEKLHSYVNGCVAVWDELHILMDMDADSSGTLLFSTMEVLEYGILDIYRYVIPSWLN